MILIQYLIPEIIIVSSACFILILDLFLKKGYKEVSYYLIQISLIISIITIFERFDYFIGLEPLSYNTEIFSTVFKIFLLVGMVVIFHYSYNFLKYFELYKTEYFILCLFAVTGMMIMSSANDLLILYLGIELLSLSLYTIIGFNKKSIFSSEAAVKYYVLGAISSGFLLFGISLIYGLTGTLALTEIFDFIKNIQTDSASLDLYNVGLIFSLTFILVSLAFKFGAAPFHMWIPDVYHGALIPTTLLLSTLPKIAIFIVLIKLLSSAFSNLFIFWSEMILILSVISILIGNIIAIAQTNIKRMLAYSTIANIGFILIAISLGKQEAYEASMFYTISYVIMTMAAFGVLLLITLNKKPIELITDLKGLNSQHPWFAFLLLIIMLSLAGIPPLIGFHAKLSIINVLIHGGHIWLSIFVVLMTVIGAYYYLKVIKVIYFDQGAGKIYLIPSYVLISINTIILIVLGIFPSNLSVISSYTIGSLF
tara:strand:+ start:4140 stop:5582 length:1443 start_codon:yes stop_codon:yes gene_type:complete